VGDGAKRVYARACARKTGPDGIDAAGHLSPSLDAIAESCPIIIN
jgi:hypothetical protein